ncbi:thiamine pyrophosphate-binding protein [Okibacterium endophyticum]
MGDAIASSLVAGGVRRCYGVPGEFYWLLDAIERNPDLEFVSVRHEGGAAFMADAEGRLTGKPAVVVVGKGPGATNASNGVQTAFDASTPMLVIVNEPEMKNAKLDAFQQLDFDAFFAPFTKARYLGRPGDDLTAVIAQSLRIAQQGQPGPVVVTIPSDIDGDFIGPIATSAPSQPLAAPGARDIQRAADVLAQASRPVIIAGGGAQGARAELIAFAEALSVGVYAGFRRQDVFPNDHPLYLGHLAMNTPAETLASLRDADVVLVVGSKLAQMTTQRFTLPQPSAALIQIDIDPTRIGRFIPTEVGIVTDAASGLDAIRAAAPSVPARDWAGSHQVFLDSTRIVPDRSTGNGVDPSQIVSAMKQVLPEDTIITSEAGGHATFIHQHWIFPHPRSQAAPQNGTMGYAVPAAVAAQIVYPDRVVVADVGDGGFLMTGQEIETAVRMKAPVIVVVFNNNLLSAGFETESMREGRPYNLISDVDFAAYARAFGARGITVTKTAELCDAFTEARNSDIPTIIDVKTDPDIFSPRLEPLQM